MIYTDGRYIDFTNAPLPLEKTGLVGDGQQVAFEDISGAKLPGISDWSFSTGIEVFTKGKLIGQSGQFFAGGDLFYRSSFSSSPSPSAYLNVDGYALTNAKLGFRTQNGVTVFIWSRNVAM